MRFIDLFAGLGGFHYALKELGHECVFACEIDPILQNVYEKNFGIRPAGDIRNVKEKDIPTHDILCAGFPCQPFSKAGDQQGFTHPELGNLFDEHIIRIVKHHKPEFILLENVPNLKKHNEGKTWAKIEMALDEAQYEHSHRSYSPHHFGIPQIRERIFIVARRHSLEGFCFPEKDLNANPQIATVLQPPPHTDARKLSKQIIDCLEVWQEFLDLYPKEKSLSTFPIWTMDFGATYPFEEKVPYDLPLEELRQYCGSHGKPLSELPENATKEDLLLHLPSHARRKEAKKTFPSWKINYIRHNRKFYEENKSWLDEWIPKILRFPPSFQKLEWNCGASERDIWKYVLQIRASGVRVKQPTTAPSLVAMTTTQVPIIAWERRYMMPRECAALQSLNELKYLPELPTRAFQALGNAVNAHVVQVIAEALFAVHNDAKNIDASLSENEFIQEEEKAVTVRFTSSERKSPCLVQMSIEA